MHSIQATSEWIFFVSSVCLHSQKKCLKKVYRHVKRRERKKINLYFFLSFQSLLINIIHIKMTKLTEWLTGLAVFFGVYWILVTKKVSNQFTEDFYFHIQISPVVIVLLLAVSQVKQSMIINFMKHYFNEQVYAITTVIYRTLTFNECKEAADELMKEIQEAKSDLKSKGFEFNS